ncbi:MAG: DNA-deoxyinosine glycosylase [Sutterellaceae bacterium]|nr:DNA-deoxyinosine glycosylase [Burkholderiaceae bacterium]MCX7902471.1 DNA-deoxyinosine glycosylase [Burkholderiaceae bacterium]MDW8430396.1 DNA-deoxyinosine glycosylase [Sutterellaceae bacterium]
MPGSRRNARLRGFPPVIDTAVETLILGSFPSEASLAARQYYAHPRNQFWHILGAVLGEPLAELPYEVRLARVLAHRIGIWDVIGACQREGSADSAIRNAQANDFTRLRILAPQLWRIVFNGAHAARFAARFRSAGYLVRVAPSSSPAHAGRTLTQKIELWRQALADVRPPIASYF